MGPSTRTYRRAGSASAVAVGGVLIGWGLLSLSSPTWHANTISLLDTLLATVSRFVWVPALGLMLVLVGVLPNLHVRVKRSDLWLAVSLLGGVALLGLGTLFTIIVLNPIAGAIYSAPLTISGVVLLAVGASARKYNLPVTN